MFLFLFRPVSLVLFVFVFGAKMFGRLRGEAKSTIRVESFLVDLDAVWCGDCTLFEKPSQREAYFRIKCLFVCRPGKCQCPHCSQVRMRARHFFDFILYFRKRPSHVPLALNGHFNNNSENCMYRCVAISHFGHFTLSTSFASSSMARFVLVTQSRRHVLRLTYRTGSGKFWFSIQRHCESVWKSRVNWSAKIAARANPLSAYNTDGDEWPIRYYFH